VLFLLDPLIATHDKMDPKYPWIPPQQGISQSFRYPSASQTMPHQGGRPRVIPPTDINGALRYTPMTSVVPPTGGKNSFLKSGTLLMTTVLQVIPPPQFAYSFPTEFPLNPETEAQLQQYFDLMGRNAFTPQERDFQLEEMRNILNLVNQVDDRNMCALHRPG
jgi:hypothetical protein